MIRIELDTPARDDVARLLDEHLTDMLATSPADSVHALDHTALSGPDIRFWTARDGPALLGCAALQTFPPNAGEIKSMRTATAARGRGVASFLLTHLVDAARQARLDGIYLETGTQEYFAPARRLYQRHGFTECPPYADYRPDPNSVFMHRALPAFP
ncbi:GNAT family N-acetyltransferase [Arthrobacter sp. CAN_C5]|uniref:GNAT family N-acetyltransferase n=1 Tax=Arthrobacter sp. CAN_C5 TaxID=2760706 RepID=UPI001AE4FA75|nr:GNAT family N-acetyltransferase [Arthrobacter sp. CAN_C5]MBP2215236.1 putative acetyltransferase [Arthrobacter sp. CAN_C5]